jgi:aminoglycoside/choline kinase family phosphotransferase
MAGRPGDLRVRQYLERAGLPPDTPTIPLPGDASTRRYVRFSDPTRGSLMLLVHPTPIDLETLPFLNVVELLKRMDVRVPAILESEPDLGILVIEDLGDVTLQDYLKNASDDDKTRRYGEAVAIIGRMQQGGRTLTSSSSRYQPFGLAFDVEKLLWELDFFLEHFVVQYRSMTLSADRRSALRGEFELLAAELAAEPRVFCHRDYHSRNLMWHRNELCVIDFQDARLGPDSYDLVSLLRDSYVDHGRDFVDGMIDAFLPLIPEARRRDFGRRFDVMSVQRHLKALGTFGYQGAVAGTTRYEDDVPRTLGYLHDVFERRSRFDQLRTLLAPSIPELG